jgi:hypothetical protein
VGGFQTALFALSDGALALFKLGWLAKIELGIETEHSVHCGANVSDKASENTHGANGSIGGHATISRRRYPAVGGD